MSANHQDGSEKVASLSHCFHRQVTPARNTAISCHGVFATSGARPCLVASGAAGKEAGFIAYGSIQVLPSRSHPAAIDRKPWWARTGVHCQFWHNLNSAVQGSGMAATILITGAAQRVGLYCALALQRAGFQVVATYRRDKPGVAELRAAGVDCQFLDISDDQQLPQDIAKLADYLKHTYGNLRAVIHNASAWQGEEPVAGGLSEQLQSDAAVFDAMMRIHAKTPYLLTRALQPLLRADADRPADVIAISDFAVNTGSCNHMAYAASKAALENLVLSLARLLAPHAKVNAIAPALVMFNDGDDEAYKQHTLQKSLMGIEPGPSEVLAAVDYLLQSRYVTGRVIAVDGGRHLKLP